MNLKYTWKIGIRKGERKIVACGIITDPYLPGLRRLAQDTCPA